MTALRRRRILGGTMDHLKTDARLLASADQVSNAADQTLSDTDQTLSDDDQASAEEDQQAADQDQMRADAAHNASSNLSAADEAAYEESRTDRKARMDARNGTGRKRLGA